MNMKATLRLTLSAPSFFFSLPRPHNIWADDGLPRLGEGARKIVHLVGRGLHRLTVLNYHDVGLGLGELGEGRENATGY